MPSSFARRVAACFLPFAAGYVVSYIFRSVNAVIGPDLLSDLHVDAAALGLLTSAYFAAFAVFQLPLGVLLDRYGPRVVQSALMLVTAAGALVFAAADGLALLVAGRVLIGLGLCGCLMAAFKANVMFWPRQALPLANGFIHASGGVGAALATVPVQALRDATSWRFVFVALAALTVLSALFIRLAVPRQSSGAPASWTAQVRGVAQVFRAPVFRRTVPFLVMAQATYLSYPTLWSAAWLRDVAGLDRDAVAQVLLAATLAMIPGAILAGWSYDALTRRGVSGLIVLPVLNGAFLVLQIPLALNVVAGSTALWVGFGFLGTVSILSFAYMTHQYPPELAGRVNTAINLCAFVLAFAFQAGIGWIIGLYPGAVGADGAVRFSPEGHRAAFLTVIALQAAGLAWFLLPRRRR